MDILIAVLAVVGLLVVMFWVVTIVGAVFWKKPTPPHDYVGHSLLINGVVVGTITLYDPTTSTLTFQERSHDN